MLPQSVPRRALVPVLVAILVFSALPFPTASAGTTTIMSATLPSPRDGTSAVGTPDGIYLFGGDSGTRTDQILRYDAVTDTITVMGATLPTPRSGTSAIWNGTHAFIFGGWGSPYTDQIVSYDPASDSVAIMAAKLPSGRTYTSAVWTGTHAYIFGGGTSASTTTDQIVRYDPATDTIATMAAKLPSGRYGTSATWDGTHIHIFGGYTISTGVAHDQIVRYDPSTDSVSVLAAKLPAPRYHTSAIHAGGQTQIFGGYPCGTSSACGQVVTFDPAAGTLAINTTALSSARYLTSAATYDRDAYIFGGNDGDRNHQVLRMAGVAPNHAPLIASLADLTVQASLAVQVDVSATDADDDPITLTAGPLPAGATFTDLGGGKGSFDWTPARGQEGDHVIAITASDPETSTTRAFTINVTEAPDRPPVLEPIGDQAIYSGDPFTLGITATDEDGDPITLGLAPVPANATFTDHGDGTATFTWTPGRDETGTYTIEVQASAANATDNETFEIVVTLPPNRAPVIDPIPDRQIFPGDTLTITARATDADGDPITLSIGTTATGFTFTDHGDGTATFQWTVGQSHVGDHIFNVIASDGSLNGTETFLVDVAAGPPPTIVAIADQTIAEGHVFTQVVSASDPEGRTIVLTLAVDPPVPAINWTDEGNGAGTIYWNTTYDSAGTYDLTITADNSEAAATETFRLTVTNVDLPPVLVGAPWTIQIGTSETARLDVQATDPDGDPISLSAGGLVNGATFTDLGGGNGRFEWPDAGPKGTHTFDVFADSGTSSTTGQITVKVVPLYEFTVRPIGASRYLASPGEVIDLPFRIQNTGARNDTVSLSAFDSAGMRQGFTVTTVPTTTLAVGQSVDLIVQVTVPADGVYAKPRVVGTSAGDPTFKKQLNWVLEVPVHIQVIPNPAQASISGGTALVLFNGTVQFTWNDGSPASGIAFTWAHSMVSLSLSTGSSVSDGDGRWAFDGLTDPTLGLPGDHRLDVSVYRVPRTDQGTATWFVGA